MRTKTLKINGKETEAILMAGGKGFKIYSFSEGLIVDKGREKIILQENTPAYEVVIDYVNLRYHNIDQQKEITEKFQSWLNTTKKENPRRHNMKKISKKPSAIKKTMKKPQRRGTVEWFDGEEGFIRDNKDKQSYFVHSSALRKPGLKKGQEVDYDLYENLYMKQVDKVYNPKKKRNPMRTLQKEFRVGKFEDFSPKDQAKIIDNYRDINVDYEWYDSDLEDLETILSILGFSKIKINFTGFASQGDGASFTGMFTPGTKTELKKRVKKLAEYAPQFPVFNFESMKFSKDEIEGGEVEVYRIDRRYYHYNTIDCDNEDLKAFARKMSQQIYKLLEQQYDHLTSDEAVKETLEANEYEFDERTLKIY